MIIIIIKYDNIQLTNAVSLQLMRERKVIFDVYRSTSHESNRKRSVLGICINKNVQILFAIWKKKNNWWWAN